MAYRGDTIGWNACTSGMFPNAILVWREVNAVELVLGDVTVEPLNLWPHFPQRADERSANSRIWGSDNAPAPGISRSITNCGIIPRLTPSPIGLLQSAHSLFQGLSSPLPQFHVSFNAYSRADGPRIGCASATRKQYVMLAD